MYKALMLDIDGTIIPYDYHANPTDRVVSAIKKAQEKVVVSFVTGRSYSSVQRLIDYMGITKGYAAVSNGSAVIDLENNKMLYDMPIEKRDSDEIIKILHEEQIRFYIKKDIHEDGLDRTLFVPNSKYKKTYMIFTLEEFSHERVNLLFKRLSHIPSITLHKTRHNEPNKFGFNITHAKATKAHGIETILTHVKLKRAEVIAIGDSYNDFALLMAAGLKVAMGNALPELKSVADVIAPSVNNDGVAEIIEKYIFKNGA